MKLKFIKPPKQKYNKEKLYRLALRQAVSQLTLDGNYKTYESAYSSIMGKAKIEYRSRYGD